MNKLRSLLHQIDGRGYKAYKAIQQRYPFPNFTLAVEHVQSDPFAAPSRISIRVTHDFAAFEKQLYATPTRKIAFEDYLRRALAKAISYHVNGRRGIGKSGQINIERGGQQILQRNAVLVTKDFIEARLTMGLPARGRTIAAREAEEMFFKELPHIVEDGLHGPNLDLAAIITHIETMEDQAFLRAWLAEQGLVAFVANGASLPRRSGVDDRPLEDNAVVFKAPDSLQVSLELPNFGNLCGLGIPRGVTLIVGGGFHGKSTLLHALERGIYNHIPGDGRERAVTEATACKIRAEDGRIIHEVDISGFIDNLPLGKDTQRFSTENASGSTSQAANIIEALCAGARLLLIDEDTCATNFMIRDQRMQALVANDKEPITPFLHRARELYQDHGVSSIIVMGGCGDYFDVADTVIMLDAYRPIDVTEKAKHIAEDKDKKEAQQPYHLKPIALRQKRKPKRHLLDPSKGKKDVKINVRNKSNIAYGRHDIDLSRVEQLVDAAQTETIGLILHYFNEHYYAQESDIVMGMHRVLDDIERHGLDIVAPYKTGSLALPRLFEILAATNRIRPHDES